MTHYSDSVVWFLLPFSAIGLWWSTWRVLDELFGWRGLRRKLRKLTKEQLSGTVVRDGVVYFGTVDGSVNPYLAALEADE